MTILNTGYVLFECSYDSDGIFRKAISFSENKNELGEKSLKLEKQHKDLKSLKESIELYRKSYESAWKFEICPKSAEEHRLVKESKEKSGNAYKKLLNSRKVEFTKNWVSSNPIPFEFKSFVKFDSTKDFEIRIIYPSEVWYEIDELEDGE